MHLTFDLVFNLNFSIAPDANTNGAASRDHAPHHTQTGKPIHVPPAADERALAGDEGRDQYDHHDEADEARGARPQRQRASPCLNLRRGLLHGEDGASAAGQHQEDEAHELGNVVAGRKVATNDGEVRATPIDESTVRRFGRGGGHLGDLRPANGAISTGVREIFVLVGN